MLKVLMTCGSFTTTLVWHPPQGSGVMFPWVFRASPLVTRQQQSTGSPTGGALSGFSKGPCTDWPVCLLGCCNLLYCADTSWRHVSLGSFLTFHLEKKTDAVASQPALCWSLSPPGGQSENDKHNEDDSETFNLLITHHIQCIYIYIYTVYYTLF